ncbi:MAG TPA: heavy-metal-associated domain-containing protein [Chloroflexota bacterium]|jgi:copper chaperone CopZ|nr:heavy-metal-associated domain-containing protein [Chloroflexota bacterium]
MESITLTAPDISCEHCQRAIETALSEMGGVAHVAVDITAKAVAVAFDPQKTSRDAIVERLDLEGYPVAS